MFGVFRGATRTSVSPYKTFTPFFLTTTAVLLLALTSCEDNNPQVDEKPGHGPNQAIDQRIETFEGRSGQAEQRTNSGQRDNDPNNMQPQPNMMGTSTGGTSTGGTSTGGTSTSGTSGDKPTTTTGTTSTTGTTTTDQDP